MIGLAGCAAEPTEDPNRAGLVADESRDLDADGVVDTDDLCANTIMPEKAPSLGLTTQRHVMLDDSGMFSTRAADGEIGHGTFSIGDTAGCSCAQLIESMGLGDSHTRFGCTAFALQEWISTL